MSPSFRRACLLALAGLVLLWTSPAAAGRVVKLDEAFRLAMKNHPSIKILQERVSAAEASRYKTWTAVKPTAYMQPNLSIYDNEVIIPAGQMGAWCSRRSTSGACS